MTYLETDLVTKIEQLFDDRLDALTQSQLDRIDQFHGGGPGAVGRLLPSLGLTADMTVLDVGSGLGGPARQVARSTGCSVVGVDPTKSYVDTAQALTQATGLTDQVSFIWGDISDVFPDDFDAAYVIHVQMNVADKGAFYDAIASRLRSGATLATFEVCKGQQGEPATPLPWSLDGTDSFLVTPSDLRATIEASGFTTSAWVDETAAVLDWFQQIARSPVDHGPAPMLPALLIDGPTRMMNFAKGLGDGTLTVHRGAFVLADAQSISGRS